MRPSNRTISTLERVVLRGIEGIIGDGYLQDVITGSTEGMEDFYEAKYMAEQVLAQWRGWGME